MAEARAASSLPARGVIDLPDGMLPGGAAFAVAGWAMAAAPIRLDGFVGISRATMNLPDWLKLCRVAHALWQGGRKE
jgi:hypothetical protein